MTDITPSKSLKLDHSLVQRSASTMLNRLDALNSLDIEKILRKLINTSDIPSSLFAKIIFDCSSSNEDSKSFSRLLSKMCKDKTFKEVFIRNCLSEIENQMKYFSTQKEITITKEDKKFIKNIEFIGKNFKESQTLNEKISEFQKFWETLLFKEEFGEDDVESDISDEEETESEINDESDKEIESETEIDQTEELNSIKDDDDDEQIDELDQQFQEINLNSDQYSFEEKMKENDQEIKVLIDHLPQKYLTILNTLDLEHLVEIEMDFNRLPKAHFFKSRIVKISDDLVTMEDIQYITKSLKILPNNRSGIEKYLHRISVIKSLEDVIIGITLRVGKPIYGISLALKDILDSKKSILFLGAPGCGKTSKN
jgi:hypothetical protein